MSELAKLFEKIKFRKKLFGGVDQIDVFRKLEKIQEAYEQQEARLIAKYEGQLEMKEQQIQKLMEQLKGHE